MSVLCPVRHGTKFEKNPVRKIELTECPDVKLTHVPKYYKRHLDSVL